ncbi:MAG: hypothetical protein JXB26_04855 [Candidatus Aminicenantes bacterium]|nr:hypothetical protein [Candidatus Aminicenantes bacterium]
MAINFERLIQLQDIDINIKQTTLFITDIPSKIEYIRKKIDETHQIVSQAKEKMAQNQKNRRDMEGEVKDVKELVKKYKLQQNSLKSNREYQSLTREIEMAQAKIDQLEENILNEMLAADDIEVEIKEAEKKRQDVETTYIDEIKNLEEQKIAKEKELEELQQKRKEIEPQIPEEQMQLYLNLSKNRIGIALSPIYDEFCSMCHMRIRPQVINELIEKKSIILCENCGRILYWNEKPA